MNTEPDVKSTDVSEAADPRFFAALITHFVHLDTNMWGRIQYLGLVQAGAFGSAYTLRAHPGISAAIFAAAALLTTILLLLMKRDEAIRDANAPLLQHLGHLLAKPYGAAFVLSPPPKWPACFRGRELNLITFCLFMGFDICGFGYFLLLFLR